MSARRVPPRRIEVAARCALGVAAGHAASPGVACASEPVLNRIGLVWSRPIPPWRCGFSLAFAVFRPGTTVAECGGTAPGASVLLQSLLGLRPPGRLAWRARRISFHEVSSPIATGWSSAYRAGGHRLPCHRPRRFDALGDFSSLHSLRGRIGAPPRRGSPFRGSLLPGSRTGFRPPLPSGRCAFRLRIGVARSGSFGARLQGLAPPGNAQSRRKFRRRPAPLLGFSSFGFSSPAAGAPSRPVRRCLGRLRLFLSACDLAGFGSRPTRTRFLACPLSAPCGCAARPALPALSRRARWGYSNRRASTDCRGFSEEGPGSPPARTAPGERGGVRRAAGRCGPSPAS